jgi:spermidine synthase
MFTFFLSFLIPQTLEKVDSPINGLIIVEKFFGKNRISVAGFWQSGEYSKGVMKRALRILPYKRDLVKNILLLGVGGGSAIEVINKLFPNAKIIGVDNDPCMTEIGKKYFNLDKAKNLNIVIADAYKFLLNCKRQKIYDIILTDLYIGCNYPSFIEKKDYLNQIKQLLVDGGVYIFNGSYTKQNKEVTDKLVEKIKTQFPKVELIHKKPNLIIQAYKTGGDST